MIEKTCHYHYFISIKLWFALKFLKLSISQFFLAVLDFIFLFFREVNSVRGGVIGSHTMIFEFMTSIFLIEKT